MENSNDNTQLNAILSSMGEGLVVVDLDLRVVLMNQAAGVLLRLAPSEATGRLIDEVLVLYHRGAPVVLSPAEQAINDKNIVTIGVVDDFFIKNRARQLFAITLVAAPLLKNNEVAGAIVLFRDATKERQIDQAKTEFVSLASHQLRTPLSAIGWYTEMMLDGDLGALSDKQREYLENLRGANQQMVQLVNSLLNVSRLDLGTVAIEPQPLDLREATEAILTTLTPQIAAKSLRLTKDFAANLPIINADPKIVGIILQNLLSNAIKYTPTGGEIKIILAERTGAVLITVTDTGFGIPSAEQGKIFTKLFRADNIKDKSAEGTGLGLYIVKSVIEAAGGKIWFDSLEGRGTSFFVSLPQDSPRRAGSKDLV